MTETDDINWAGITRPYLQPCHSGLAAAGRRGITHPLAGLLVRGWAHTITIIAVPADRGEAELKLTMSVADAEQLARRILVWCQDIRRLDVVTESQHTGEQP